MISIGDARQATRTPRAEIVETLYADLDFAASVLPPVWSADGKNGRITQGAANALKARIALYERSEEHTSELQSLMRISYAVFCLKKKTKKHTTNTRIKTNYKYKTQNPY